jgi:alpha-tubulin suppressor-like RCC1 family protein
LNSSGQLGIGGSDNSPVPMPVDPTNLGAGVVLVYAGGTHTCARDAHSALWCWGGNGYGQLGTIDGAGSPVPVQISPQCP